MPVARTYRGLIADDNAHVRSMLVRSLGRPGALAPAVELEFLEADDGEAAWEHLERGGIDLVVLDFYMPGMDGGHLLELIRSTPALATLPVLAVSSEPDRRGPTLSGGADAFLPKPLRLVDVSDAVRSLLRL
jgi:CheY-like chemotaxis protein